jgi:hypothetical protein
MVQPGGNMCAKGARAARVAGQLKKDMVFIPRSALGAARADPLSAANPTQPLPNGGERGAPQPEAHNLEHLRRAQAQAEKCVALS